MRTDFHLLQKHLKFIYTLQKHWHTYQVSETCEVYKKATVVFVGTHRKLQDDNATRHVHAALKKHIAIVRTRPKA